MDHQEKNYEIPEEELQPSSVGLYIPKWLRWLASAIGVALIVFCAVYTFMYLSCPKVYASPRELGLTGIFLFSISAVLIVWIPWPRLGVRISKIGGIEFKEIVQGQASEHAEEISYLEDRIASLEGRFREKDETGDMIEAIREPDLRKVLLEFLNKYNDSAFSPSRIRVWGARQPGFKSLSDYDHPFIRRTLQKMVAENILETRISKKGNTLYKVISS